MNTIYIGWDARESLAYEVARASILCRTDPEQVQVIPLKLDLVKSILTRPIEQKDGKLWCPISQAPMATEFAISRFCVPHLQHSGFAVFMDCDIVCLTDIRDLFALADPQYAVQLVKHNYQPTETIKMMDQIQTSYSRKNWSSVVLWNCEHPSRDRLTLDNLNLWPGRDLHAFRWLLDAEIGELDSEWNSLVGINANVRYAKIMHFTNGGMWIPGWNHDQICERSICDICDCDIVWDMERLAAGL